MKPIYIEIENPEDWSFAMARAAEGLAQILVKELPPEEIKKLIKGLREMKE